MQKDSANFNDLKEALKNLYADLETKGFLTLDSITSEEVLKTLNTNNFMLTLHDVEYYRPVCLNDKMSEFYGFDHNWLKGLDHVYYLNTIHHSTYNALLESMTFFRQDKREFLPLHYKLRYRKKEWRHVIGVTKTMVRKKNGKPKYAITLAIENKSISILNKVDNVKPLSTRELEVARLLCAGFSRVSVAEQLSLSKHTVDSHVKKIFRKTGVNKVSELTIYLEKYSV